MICLALGSAPSWIILLLAAFHECSSLAVRCGLGVREVPPPRHSPLVYRAVYFPDLFWCVDVIPLPEHYGDIEYTHLHLQGEAAFQIGARPVGPGAF